MSFDPAFQAGGDSSAPDVSIVSPDLAVAPGEAGGFPADYRAAAVTPIVLEIVDSAPGNRIVTIVFQQEASATTHKLEEVIYRRGAFRGGYIAGSWQEAITDGVRLHCVRAEGWPGSDAPAWTLSVDAVDEDGNLT